MIENYDDLNVDATLDAVADFSNQELREFVEFEKAHKDRKTVVEPLEAELDSEAQPPDDVTVRKVEGNGYAAGYWFDGPRETKTVPKTVRVERAIDDGRLEEVN